MKLKYYLRGLGIGILVTAVIMGVTQGSRKETLSDREIKERAAALGMVEPGNSLADLEAAAAKETQDTAGNGQDETGAVQDGNAGTTEENGEDAAVSAETPEATESTPAPSEKPSAAPTPSETAEPAKSDAEAAEAAETPEETASPAATVRPTQKPAEEETGSTYTLEIQSGDSSYQVALRLQQAGLVADARDFDNYLCSKGYDRKLRTGSYEISENATEAEIAEILGGR